MMELEVDDFNTFATHNLCDSSTWAVGTDSTWTLTDASKKLLIGKAELQFTNDVDLGGQSVYFDTHIVHPIYGPMHVERIEYPDFYSIFARGNDHYTSPLPNYLRTVDRDTITTVKFNYPKILELDPSLSTELRVSLSGHTELGGTYATVSFLAGWYD